MARPTHNVARPHRSEGTRAPRWPPRPNAGVSLSAPSPPPPARVDGGAAASGALGGGAGSLTAPCNAATTTNRCDAEYRGLHVVSVSRLSVVGFTTDVSDG